jgi:hypothetical protein
VQGVQASHPAQVSTYAVYPLRSSRVLYKDREEKNGEEGEIKPGTYVEPPAKRQMAEG